MNFFSLLLLLCVKAGKKVKGEPRNKQYKKNNDKKKFSIVFYNHLGFVISSLKTNPMQSKIKYRKSEINKYVFPLVQCASYCESLTKLHLKQKETVNNKRLQFTSHQNGEKLPKATTV